MAVNLEHMQAWWNRLLADEAKMNAWLQKLQITELDGYRSNLQAIKDFGVWRNTLAHRILTQTANDELKHSDMLIALLKARGVEPLPQDSEPTSLYWEIVGKVVTDLSTFAAMTHFGEQLAVERFKFIMHAEGTPPDILAFVAAVLPEERYHAQVFMSLTDAQSVALVEVFHEKAVQAVTKSKGN